MSLIEQIPYDIRLGLQSMEGDPDEKMLRILRAFMKGDIHNLDEKLLEFEKTKMLPGTDLRKRIEALVEKTEALLSRANTAILNNQALRRHILKKQKPFLSE